MRLPRLRKTWAEQDDEQKELVVAEYLEVF